MTQLLMISPDEHQLRLSKLRGLMHDSNIDGLLISNYANIYYLTGRVFTGYIYVPAEGNATMFVRRPVGLSGDRIIYIRKPEQITEFISTEKTATVGLELDIASYSSVQRLKTLFPASLIVNATPLMRASRSVKTPAEIRQIADSGVKHERVYRRIPELYRTGMTDIDLQVELEHEARREGCLGQFRISGDTMELYMANILTGENADTPTPYDFAMGGAGLDPSLPVGADGSTIEEGHTVMVDFNGNFTGYMTDMTRTFTLGTVSHLAMKAHQCSIDICAMLAKAGKPGVEAKELFRMAEEYAISQGLGDFFMGHRQKAGFVGHGLGIEINELPVIAPRSRDILAEGNVIALEPKFVIPQTGAVGIENTYVVTPDGMHRLTNAPEQLISLQ